MKEILERLSNVMPEGWTLTPEVSHRDKPVAWCLKRTTPDSVPYGIYPDEGDIGLANLTSLLKWAVIHELDRMSFGTINDEDGQRWDAIECGDREIHSSWNHTGKTEFEAVAYFYLAIAEMGKV